MTIDRVPTFVELGLVGKVLAETYAPHKSTDYRRILTDFKEGGHNVPPELHTLYSMFNPQGWRTFGALLEVSKHSQSTIGDVIRSLLNDYSITASAMAEGIMSTRLNLPLQVYEALESVWMKQWSEKIPKGRYSEFKEGDLRYAIILYNAVQRYKQALRRLSPFFEQTSTGLVLVNVKKTC